MIQKLAQIAGFISSMSSFFQYFPQIVYNYKRKSVEGFSSSSIIIKLVGASFLLVNSITLGETVPVVLYGLSNLVAHSTFMFQFCFYVDPDKTQHRKYGYILWVLFPIVPFLIAVMFPWSTPYTGMIKPVSQLLSHIPQLYECYKLKTTKGVSLTSQHLNTLCGTFGLFMCHYIPPKTGWTYVLYINSLFQALTIYLCALIYDGPAHLKSNILPF